MKTYNKVLALIWLVTLIMFFWGCDASVKGDTTHTVQGEATVRIVVGVDVTACEGLEPAAKAECIQAMIELAKVMQQAKETQE